MIGLYNKDDRKNLKTLCIADFTIRMTEKLPVPFFYIGNISDIETFFYIETRIGGSFCHPYYINRFEGENILKKCRLLSFDTSTTRSGFAKFENGVLVEHGSFDHKNEKSDPLIRIENMIADLNAYVLKNKPDIVVIERPPQCKDADTLINLAEIVGTVRGVSLIYAEYVEYSPNKWRRLVADLEETIPTSRKLSKPWDMKKVEDLFGFIVDNDDEADAILIGLARIKEMEALQNKQAI